MRFPRPVTRAAIMAYAKYFGVALDDVDPDQLRRGFLSFDEFFTRKLRPGARSLAANSDLFVSPCDGFLREAVEVQAGSTVVAKGHEYSVGELLGDQGLAQQFVGGLQVTIYLHPRDYHRVHAPCSGEIKSMTAVPGRLLPVTDASLDREPRLFSLNERLIHRLDTPRGAVCVVMVAAFGVGHMTCAYRVSEPHPLERIHETIEPAVKVDRGGELGIFHLGSTVVLYVERGFELASGVEPGPIRFGMPLLRAKGGRP